MTPYQILLKAYKEGLHVRIKFLDGAVEPDTTILEIDEEFKFVPSEEYIAFYDHENDTKQYHWTTAFYDAVESVEILQ